MPQPLRVLIVEDSEEDATLLLQELRAGGYVPISERVETAEAMKAALREQSWDLVISDYVMPGFGGLEALKLLQESGLDLPFILTSGKIGEMTAVEAMKAGVHDYVLKYNLTRLVPAIQRALQEAAARRENKQAEEVLRESEQRYRNLIESSHDLIQSVAPDGRFLYVNRVWMDTLGYSQEELPRLSLFDLIHPDFHAHCQTMFQRIMSGEQIDHIAVAYVAKDGRVISLEGNAIPRLMGGKVIATQSFFRDLTEQKQAEEETRRHSDTQAVINSLLRRSLENVPPDELLGYALDLVLSIPWLSFQSRGCIFLVEEDPEALVMKAQNGLAKPIQKACGQVPFGRCLCGRAASTKEVQFSDCRDERHDITCEGIFPHGHYCVPILSAGRVRGVMNLYLKEGHRREAKEEEFLQAVANALAGIIERKQAEEKLGESHESLITILDSLEADIYVADLKTYEVLFVNQHMRDSFGESALGEKCWKVFRRDSGPCASCSNDRLIDAQGNPTGVYTWEGQNPLTHKWYVNYDRAIRWIDGHLVRLQIAIDITDRKRAEEALRQSEVRYRAVVQQSPDGIFLDDVETRCILEANEAFQKLLGYSAEEIQRLTIYDIIAADREDIDQRFEKILGTEGPFTHERQYRRKDGFLVDVWISAKVISYGGRRATCVLVRDLTERKWREEEHRTILRTALDGFWIADTQGHFLDVNDAYCCLTGYSRDELLTMRIRDVEALETPEVTAQRIRKIMETGEDRFETKHRCKDGKIIDVEVSVNYLPEGNGRMFVFLRDVSQRKRAEKALRESEERYRAIIEQSADGIYLVDVDTERIIEANRALAQMLGYTQEEMQGMHNYLLVEATPENIERRFQEILTSPSPLSFERRFRKKDGSLLDVWITAGVLFFGGKRAACGIIKDLTERKQAEQEREQLIDELQEALANIKTLSGLIPICAQCKKIRDDKGYWQQVEVYVRDHSQAKFSHGLCPECVEKFLRREG